ncbi:hypothetical protein [Caloranaerobacter sp. DY30410]|uniref:hypothetical protein n=1 Tax=Caloranaerobacter sp. DY30410 TaxID=3238305 RepID=UPI003CFF9944
MNFSDQTQVMKNKRMRGQILRTLTLFYPSSTSVREVKTALITRGMTAGADVTKYLCYLEDKGYIRRNDGMLKDVEDDDQIELTAKGIDLIEGTIEDPGVMI